MLKRLLFVVLMALAFAANATVYSLPWGPKPQFVDANGAPMTSGTLQTLVGGTSTPQVTYTDSTGGSSNPTTITLNSRGETPNEVWLSAGAVYKFILKDSGGVTVWTVDGVSGVNDVTAQLGQEWVVSTLTPTFVSATSFTVTGDQTLVLHAGRRLKTTNSGGTVYSTITATAFAAVTTVTVVNDSGTMDSGLSAVSYGLLSAINPSIGPDITTRKGTAIASAATTNIWGIAGDFVHVTGTTTITSLGTAPYAGAQRTVIFDSGLVLTHNATTLQLPGGASHPVQAGDRIMVRADTTANMIVTNIARTQADPALLTIAKSMRLTLTTAVPVTTSDVTAATSHFCTPYSGQFTEMTQTTSDTTKSPAAVANNSNYDIFLWNDVGTLRCTRGPAWTSDTGRGSGAGTTELARVNGILVNNVAISNGPAAQVGIYVGSVRSNGSAQLNDSVLLRNVWNNFNRRQRNLSVVDTTNSWTYTLAAYRQANAAAANQVTVMRGLDEDVLAMELKAIGANDGANAISAGIGLTSSTVNSAQVHQFVQNTQVSSITAKYTGFPGIGYYEVRWLEFSVAAGTSTWFGDNGNTGSGQAGMSGEAWQ